MTTTTTDTATRWLPDHVTIDGDPTFPAEIDTTTRWNGWACPRFTREVAERVMVMVTADGSTWRWDGDVLVLTMLDADEPERWEPDADGRYHVGSWSWVWTEAWSCPAVCFPAGDDLGERCGLPDDGHATHDANGRTWTAPIL